MKGRQNALKSETDHVEEIHTITCVTSSTTLPAFKKHLKSHLFSLSHNRW